MMGDLVGFGARVLRWVGGSVAALAVGGLLALRALPVGGADAIATLGRGVVLASFAMLLTLVAGVGLALLVAGVVLSVEVPAAFRPRRRPVARPEDEA